MILFSRKATKWALRCLQIVNYFILFLSNFLKYVLGMVNCIHMKCTIKWMLTDAHVHETTNTLKKQNISMTPKRLLVPLCSQALSLPSTQPTTALFSVRMKEFVFMEMELRSKYSFTSGFVHSA